MPDFVINDQSPSSDLDAPQGHAKGLIPRDYSKHPEGCFAFAEAFPDSLLITEDELDDRLQWAIEQKKTWLDMRDLYPNVLGSLDQDDYGYCWAFSSTKAMMYLHALMGTPKVFSGWCVGCQVKDFANEGGWGG